MYYTHKELLSFMKKRMQITISDDLKQQMEAAKDFYGSYSALIEQAVIEFLARPVVPSQQDIQDIQKARNQNEWISFESL